MTRVGVLALQGGFAVHTAMLARTDATICEVRRIDQLEGLDGFVLPGGESTSLLCLMEGEPWFPALRAFRDRGGALLATCAGAILLAREVLDPAQPSLGLLDAVVRRNAYGRQVDSFEAPLEVRGFGRPLRAIFIRAPRFESLGPEVETLAALDGDPVLIRQDRILAATFHPELGDDDRLHLEFLQMAGAGAGVPATGS